MVVDGLNSVAVFVLCVRMAYCIHMDNTAFLLLQSTTLQLNSVFGHLSIFDNIEIYYRHSGRTLNNCNDKSKYSSLLHTYAMSIHNNPHCQFVHQILYILCDLRIWIKFRVLIFKLTPPDDIVPLIRFPRSLSIVVRLTK